METVEDFAAYLRSCRPFICWFKGRKTNHIINDPDDTHTLCGIKRNHPKGITVKPRLTINMCKRCEKINEATIHKHRNS